MPVKGRSASETEIAAMLGVLQQEGYVAEYERSVSTRLAFPEERMPPEIHIFGLKGREEGREAYLWPQGNQASERPYALVVQTLGIRTWKDVLRKLSQSKGPQE